MKATQRIYLTGTRDALVTEGHALASTLYASIGDEIPDSAAQKFGLVLGGLPDGADIARVVGADLEPLLRVATIAGVPVVIEAGFTFGSDWRVIGDGEIDEAQLLDILKNQELFVQAALIGEGAPGWVRFPWIERAIEAIQEHVDYDIANDRPHDRVSSKFADDIEYISHPVDLEKIDLAATLADPENRIESAPAGDLANDPPAPAGDTGSAGAGGAGAVAATSGDAGAPQGGAKEAPAGGDKEDKGGSDKEQKGGADKAAPAKPAKGKAAAEAKA